MYVPNKLEFESLSITLKSVLPYTPGISMNFNLLAVESATGTVKTDLQKLICSFVKLG